MHLAWTPISRPRRRWRLSDWATISATIYDCQRASRVSPGWDWLSWSRPRNETFWFQVGLLFHTCPPPSSAIKASVPGFAPMLFHFIRLVLDTLFFHFFFFNFLFFKKSGFKKLECCWEVVLVVLGNVRFVAISIGKDLGQKDSYLYLDLIIKIKRTINHRKVQIWRYLLKKVLANVIMRP